MDNTETAFSQLGQSGRGISEQIRFNNRQSKILSREEYAKQLDLGDEDSDEPDRMDYILKHLNSH